MNYLVPILFYNMFTYTMYGTSLFCANITAEDFLLLKYDEIK